MDIPETFMVGSWRTPKLFVKVKMGLRMPNSRIVWELEARS
jgi:hypothetical protein